MTILWPPFAGWMFFCSLLFRILSRTRVCRWFFPKNNSGGGTYKIMEWREGYTDSQHLWLPFEPIIYKLVYSIVFLVCNRGTVMPFTVFHYEIKWSKGLTQQYNHLKLNTSYSSSTRTNINRSKQLSSIVQNIEYKRYRKSVARFLIPLFTFSYHPKAVQAERNEVASISLSIRQDTLP